MKSLITLKRRIQDKPNAVAIMIQAVWSLSVTTAKGGYCPGGTGMGELLLDMSLIAVARLGSVKRDVKGRPSSPDKPDGRHDDMYIALRRRLPVGIL
jgi:hypothetical protein